MARNFESGSTEIITTGLGNLGFAFGNGTMAAIVTREAGGFLNSVIHAGGTSGATRYTLSISAGNVIQIRCGASTAVSTSTIAVADGWVLIAVTKTTGTTTPVMHCHKYAANTWFHENATGTLGDSSAPSGQGRLGGTNAAGAYHDGDLFAAGVWNVTFTNAQIEALAYDLRAWWQVQPRAMWVLDQAATGQLVPDLSGGGAGETSKTGTTISVNSAPPMFTYGFEPPVVWDEVVVAGGPAFPRARRPHMATLLTR